MPDEANELLRQIVDLQKQQLEEFKKETQRVADFRKIATAMQKQGLRRQTFALIFVLILGFGIVVLTYFPDIFYQPPISDQL